jgi:hypothetical protein
MTLTESRSWQRARPARFAGETLTETSVRGTIVSVKTASAAPLWLETVLQRLRELSRLEMDWDGYGSAPPSRDAILYTAQLLTELLNRGARPPSIGANTAGGVRLEWHSGGWDIEVDVVAPGDVDVWGEKVDGSEGFEGSLEDVRDELHSAMLRLSIP